MCFSGIIILSICLNSTFCAYLETGNNWTDEAVDAFDRLSYKAQWKPLMARINGYREEEHIVVPCLDLVDTNGEQVQ
jgi:hypothetical protein